MSGETFICGELIQINTTFTPVTGQATPSSATLRVVYTGTGGQRKTDSLSMTLQGDNSFMAQWDSSQARPGLVRWFASCSTPFVAVDEAEFTLVANYANPSFNL